MPEGLERVRFSIDSSFSVNEVVSPSELVNFRDKTRNLYTRTGRLHDFLTDKFLQITLQGFGEGALKVDDNSQVIFFPKEVGRKISIYLQSPDKTYKAAAMLDIDANTFKHIRPGGMDGEKGPEMQIRFELWSELINDLNKVL